MLRQRLPRARDFAHFRAQWRVTSSDSGERSDERRATPIASVGALTITRAATTAARTRRAARPADHRPVGGREDGHRRRVDRLPHGARPRRQGRRRQRTRGRSLLDQVAEADQPAKVRPEQPRRLPGAAATSLATGTSRPGSTLVGLLGFFGAMLIGFASIDPPPQALPGQRRRPALRRGRRARARHHRADDLPHRHRHRPAGRGPARAVRRRNLHHQPDRPASPSANSAR